MSEKGVEPAASLYLAQRLLGASNDLRYIQTEDKVVPGMGFRPLSRQSVVATVRPILVRWGICVAPSECIKADVTPYFDKNGKQMFLHTIVQGYRITNADNPADFLLCSVCSTGADSSDRGANKALTSSEKQLFVNLFHIEIGDADESENQSPSAPKREDTELISRLNAQLLGELAARIGVKPEVVATSVGVNSINEIPASKFVELKDRLEKRAAQIAAAKKEASA